MKEFEKQFPPLSQAELESDFSDFYKDDRNAEKRGWKTALKRVLQEMQNDKFKRNLELEDWIKEELGEEK